MAYTLDISLALGAANAGLTLEAQLVNTAGANVGSAVTTGFTEIGAGNYLWHYAAFPDGHRGGVIFRVAGGGAVKTFVAINPEEAERVDVKVSTRSSHTAADVWSSATRTLTSFGTLAADIWAYATRTLTQVIAAVSPPPVVSGSTVTITRGDTVSLSFTNLGTLTGRTKLWFTVKGRTSQDDTEAILQIEETAGLVRLNGATGTAAQGSISVTDATAGNLTVTIAAVASAQLPSGGSARYDIQRLVGSTVTTLTSGIFTVNDQPDVTRATS